MTQASERARLLSRLRMQLSVQAQHIKESGGNVDAELQAAMEAAEAGDYSRVRELLKEAESKGANSAD